LIPQNQADFGVEEDRVLLSGSEANKELLWVVKRGRHAGIAEQDSPPYRFEVIQEWAYGLTWAEIRGLCYDIFPGDEDEDDAFMERDQDVETNRYDVVDEYSWNLLD
jgi:hypothetical protein